MDLFTYTQIPRRRKKKENDIICITVMHAFGDNAYVITQLNAIFKIEMITI